MFVLREAKLGDLDFLYELAKYLEEAGYRNNRHLPYDRLRLERHIAASIESFKNSGPPKIERRYLFVLEDIHQKLVLGASGLQAISASKKTASEIGGLILHPDYRNLKLRLGTHLSYARFIYIALHPDRFQSEITAEVPSDSIPARRILEDIGFNAREHSGETQRFAHLVAKTNAISIVARLKKLILSPTRLQFSGSLTWVGFDGSSGFQCLCVHHEPDGDKTILSEEAIHQMRNNGADLDSLYIISF